MLPSLFLEYWRYAPKVCWWPSESWAAVSASRSWPVASQNWDAGAVLVREHPLHTGVLHSTSTEVFLMHSLSEQEPDEGELA